MKLPNNFLRWEANERLVGYKAIYTDIAGGDPLSGLMLSQIVYYHLPSHFGVNRDNKLYVKKKGKQWLVKSEHDWYQELRFSKSRSRRILTSLVKKGLIETKIYRFKGTPTTHIHLNLNIFLELWLKYASPESADSVLSESADSVLSESADSVLSESADSVLSESADSALSESAETSQSLIKRREEKVRDRQKEPPPSSSFSFVLSSLEKINQNFDKPMTGLESLAKKLVVRGVTGPQVLEVWQTCQQANKPPGAFMYWIFNDVLPQVKTKSPPATHQPYEPYEESLGEILG